MFKSVRTALLAAAAIALSPALLAQIPGLPKLTTTSTPAAGAAVAETPVQTEARLQDWLKDAKASLSRLEEPSAEAQLPEGISPNALAERRRDLDQTIRSINRTLSMLASLPETQKAVNAATEANANWQGFTEKPPYSLLKLDDLINQRDATREKDATFKSSIAIFTKSLDGIEQEANSTAAAVQEIQNLAQKPDATDAAKWRLQAAETKSRLLSVRAHFVLTNIDLIGKQAAASAAQLNLLHRQLTIVRKNATLSDDDLITIKKASDDRRAALRSEIVEIKKRLKDASSARIRAKSALDELAATAKPDAPAPDLALPNTRLAAAETRVETLQFITDNLETFESLEGFIPVAYENRKALIDSKKIADQQAALNSLKALLNRLNAWEIVSANELAAVNADISKQDSNSSVIPPDDPRQPLLTELRKSLWEKQTFVQRISQTVIGHRKNVSRWVTQFEEANKSDAWYSDITGAGVSVWKRLRDVWQFPVTSSTSTRTVAGIASSETKTISLGTILTSISIFIILYLVTSRLSRRLQSAIVGRGHLAEAQANTMRTWIMILVSVGLALTTLKYFDIPLTIFAFFGGALAIGLGFGTQTLIKNFISGIIVLFERRIRVGDVIEIDANTSGKIVEINTRSSVLRNGDGKETLIPNSLFLETRVTNLTLSNRRVRRTIRVGVDYGSQPAQVTAILKECIERHGLILKDPLPVVTLEDFGADALIFAMFYWVELNNKTDSSVVASDVRIMIEKRFSEAGIEFPKTQRELNLKAAAPLKIELVSGEPTQSPPPPPKKSIP